MKAYRNFSSGIGGHMEGHRSADSEQAPAAVRPRRRPRRDAELNRERILAAAVSVMLREGRNVPLAAIAAEAGVGVGTLYRSYADREALLHALEYRAYALLNEIPHAIENHDAIGLEGCN